MRFTQVFTRFKQAEEFAKKQDDADRSWSMTRLDDKVEVELYYVDEVAYRDEFAVPQYEVKWCE